MCLPGFRRSGAGCSECDRGQVPNDARTSCVNCAAGRYCSYPDMDAVDCGSNGLGSSVYCPSGSHEPSLTPSGSYSTGGGTNTRTGYSTCPVRGFHLAVLRARVCVCACVCVVHCTALHCTALHCTCGVLFDTAALRPASIV